MKGRWQPSTSVSMPSINWRTKLTSRTSPCVSSPRIGPYGCQCPVTSQINCSWQQPERRTLLSVKIQNQTSRNSQRSALRRTPRIKIPDPTKRRDQSRFLEVKSLVIKILKHLTFWNKIIVKILYKLTSLRIDQAQPKVPFWRPFKECLVAHIPPYYQ